MSAPKCASPNQTPAASTGPGCFPEKRAHEAMAFSDPFRSVTTKTAAADKSQFKKAQTTQTRQRTTNQSRVASANETFVAAQNELAIRAAPTPATTAAKATAIRRKFSANRDRVVARPDSDARPDSSSSAAKVTARPSEATTIQAMASPNRSTMPASLNRNALP